MGLDSVELVLEVEKAFKITIPDKEATQIRSVGELYDSILAKTADRNADPERIWEELKIIFVERFGIAPEEIKKEAWIVRDLGLN
jgi:acyl carrier protein